VKPWSVTSKANDVDDPRSYCYQTDELLALYRHGLAPAGAVIDRNFEAEAGVSKASDDEAKAIDQHCGRIAASSEWLFDALRSERSVMGYVQTCIAFEALYGGTKGDAIVHTLSNRVAYALGETVTRRNLILKRFAAFYDRRSKIVHSGAVALSDEDVEMLGWARQTLFDSLRWELKIFAKTMKMDFDTHAEEMFEV